MKARLIALILLGMMCGWLGACGGKGRGHTHVYHGYSQHGPWWGHRSYYRDRVVVVPPDSLDIDRPEAVQLPEPPPDIPDMGMPDIDVDIEPFD